MTRRIVIACIRAFRSVSHALQSQGFPLLAFTACRQWPTCSDYAIMAVREQGVARGSLSAIRRIATCHPFAHIHA